MTFKYDEFSDVWIHPSNNCTQNDSIFVGPIGPGSATYIFTEADAGKMITFSSSVSDNCLRGQIISFNIGKLGSVQFEFGNYLFLVFLTIDSF